MQMLSTKLLKFAFSKKMFVGIFHDNSYSAMIIEIQ